MIGMSKWQHRGKNYAWKSWSNSIFLAQYAPKDIDKSEKQEIKNIYVIINELDFIRINTFISQECSTG